ncbi:hypothetical protein AB2G53_00390 [Escherichia coli]|uniref:hypothetical protein n=1 Tax=Escherichia coli TaxID=562 RepID=UPI0012FFF161|nr:hypothetical protein [Escherichia coli]EFA4228887.1 hypothetical protein [Escherichia coli O11:H15]MBW2919910.1 hypothetical protein [Escherichia coli]MCX1872028.1 hypothetical protein [Escherichia coli]MDT1464627.1 hypothetical protein [Escherichia coli]HBC6091291.1 hypothetical protein [Escherichia coli]
MTRPAGSLDKRTISANTTVPGEVKSFLLAQFLKKWRRTKMGRHTWKVSPQTESQEQKQCAGAKDRELTGNSTAAE